MLFTDTICLSFYDTYHELIEYMGGVYVLCKEQQRIYNRGEEIVTELVESVRTM